MEKNVEIVSMEVIRPLSPTPCHLRCFELSYLDQMAIPAFAPLALFYKPPPHSDSQEIRAINLSRLLLLKKSLSETLAHFYPLAGRIKDNNTIECNDDGVHFYEAFAHNYQFENVVRNPDVTKHFLPNAEGGTVLLHNATIPLLIQVTFFECGGMSIGMCVYHKVVDGASLFTLANAWATITTARSSSDDSIICVVQPEFVAAAKFLPPPIPHVKFGPNFSLGFAKFFFNEERVIKMFAFDASTMASLRAKGINSDDERVPTLVEVVSAVIWKCAMAANYSENGTTRSSYLAQAVNIRKRFVPPLPNHCIGNAVAIATSCKGENDVSDLPTLVTCIRKGLSELNLKFAEKHSRDDAILGIPYDYLELTEAHYRGEVDMQFTSLCGYPFYVDFGWGKPSWVSVNQTPTRNLAILMDARDSCGIDAWICLKDKHTMSVFEHELELPINFYLIA